MNELTMLHDHPFLVTLNPMCLLKVDGVDAKKFLQGQLTCDMEDITDTHSRIAAHCNPQGRVIFLFRLCRYQEAYYFFLPSTMQDIALTALKKYAVFFKVQLSVATLPLCGSIGQQPETFALAVPGIVTRYLWINAAIAANTTMAAFNVWKYLDITAGLPQIYPATSEKFLPHDLNLQLIDGISFSKGCYTGQEIIARMHHRGSLKNHLYRTKITADTLPAPGSTIYYRDNQRLEAGGTIIESCEEGYNQYQALVVTSEKQREMQTFCLEGGKGEVLFSGEQHV